MSVCHIVAAGDFAPERFERRDGDLVIACDAGLRHLQKLGVRPDLVVGDFDSYEGKRPTGDGVVVLPCEKDDTDSIYAARAGLSRGYRRFYLHGALGGARFSHSIANVALLSFLIENGARGVLLGGGIEATVIENETLCFPADACGYLSLFALTEGCRVRAQGVKYDYDGALDPGFPLGVSNEFIGVEARVSALFGRVLVIHEGKNLDPTAFFDSKIDF